MHIVHHFTFFRCSLGDVTNDDAYYEKALEVSDNKSVRAKVEALHDFIVVYLVGIILFVNFH